MDAAREGKARRTEEERTAQHDGRDDERGRVAMTTLHEIFELPERVHQGDFVLKLGEGVLDPRSTLESYVVTDQLRRCFDDALGFVRDAVLSRSSKAAYLHGSFGSGKSHFMAVLHHLLQGNPDARAIPELAPVVAQHRSWMDGRKFLLVPYHFTDARDVESALFAGYVQRVQKLHPDAPLPAIYRAEPIFENARRQRSQLGDELFFRLLNAGGESGGAAAKGGWGKLARGWDAARFEQALTAKLGSEERSQLLLVLLEKVFSAYQGIVAGEGERFLPLDEGLSELSRHAQSLGYDALLFFLDEFILWLASHAADPAFLAREAPKVAKLVEAQHADRPVPIVSFVARQRDLKELVGDHYTGSERFSFRDLTDWWEARFHKINLEDRNLPAIVERRILRPKSESAKRELAAASQRAMQIRQEDLDFLLSTDGDREAFQKLYPFPPVLVETLVAVSGLLQRERTALRILLTILVERGGAMELGDLVPIGDLFDFIAVGSDAFSSGTRIHFENAQRLYEKKLRPILEEEHKLRFDDLDLVHDLRPEVQRLRNDDRLAKTLLLAALVPEVPAFKALTPRRLATLNASAVKSRIPGNEGQLVLDKLRSWVSRGVGEIQIGEGTNPKVSVQITGIDVDAILEPALGEDNLGNRIRWVKRLLFDAIALQDIDTLFPRFAFSWRGTKRTAELVFGNVWELTDDSLKQDGEEWKVVIDFPFDRDGKRPSDDVERLFRFRTTHERTRTLVWLPRFFSADVQRQLGRLCVIDHVLSGERFAGYAARLHVDERERARRLLENQRNTLEQQMKDALLTAYGLASSNPKQIDESAELEDDAQFQSLWSSFELRRPAAPNLRAALEQLLEQALAQQYPAHPRFEEGTKLGTKALATALDHLRLALQAPGQRYEVPRDLRRDLKPLYDGLRFGEMGEQHLVLDKHWKNHFERLAAANDVSITVGNLRAFLDDPKPMGLQRELADLVIRFFAEQTNRSFFLHGGPWKDTGGPLPDAVELRAEDLPDEALWKTALERARTLFGLVLLDYRSASNLKRFEEDLLDAVRKLRDEAQAFVPELEKRTREFVGAGTATARLTTARSAAALVQALSGAKGVALCHRLAEAKLETSADAVALSLRQSATLRAKLQATNWDLLQVLLNPRPDQEPRARAIAEKLAQALRHDELAQSLADVLVAVGREVTQLVVTSAPRESAPLAPPVPSAGKDPAPPAPSSALFDEGSRSSLDAAAFRTLVEDLRAKLAADPTLRLHLQWRITRQR
jgi:hypothetical protein